MHKSVPFSRVAGREFVPQAIVDRPLSYFADALKLPIVRGHDDFDEFEATAVELGDHLLVELKHYAGYPPNTTTIYLPYEVTNVERITELIRFISHELGIKNSWISWQRADDPNL